MGPRVLLGVNRSSTAAELLPKLLARAGCRTTLVAPSRALVAKSYLVEKRRLTPATMAGYLAEFRDELLTGEYSWAILADGAHWLGLWATCGRRALEPWSPVPFDDPNGHVVFSHHAFLERAHACGVPVSGGQPQGVTEVLYDRGRPMCWISSLFVEGRASRRIVGSNALDAIVDRVGLLSRFHGFATIGWTRDSEGAHAVCGFKPGPAGGYALTPKAEAAFAAAIRAMLSNDSNYGPYAVAATPGIVPVTPDYGVFLAEHIVESSPESWARFAMMLARIPYRDPSIAAEHLRVAFSFVFNGLGALQRAGREAARRKRSLTAAPSPSSRGATTTIASEPSSSAARMSA